MEGRISGAVQRLAKASSWWTCHPCTMAEKPSPDRGYVTARCGHMAPSWVRAARSHLMRRHGNGSGGATSPLGAVSPCRAMADQTAHLTARTLQKRRQDCQPSDPHNRIVFCDICTRKDVARSTLMPINHIMERRTVHQAFDLQASCRGQSAARPHRETHPCGALETCLVAGVTPLPDGEFGRVGVGMQERRGRSIGVCEHRIDRCPALAAPALPAVPKDTSIAACARAIQVVVDHHRAASCVNLQTASVVHSVAGGSFVQLCTSVSKQHSYVFHVGALCVSPSGDGHLTYVERSQPAMTALN